ncbi:hypothetical protein B1222_23880 (plasmid) [Paenibacillus larvae subsp. pulvifaciens]|nr:hypothetical protein B1222_23880 [Paenibacillus larvae subsp. pulvifaciens]
MGNSRKVRVDSGKHIVGISMKSQERMVEMLMHFFVLNLGGYLRGGGRNALHFMIICVVL